MISVTEGSDGYWAVWEGDYLAFLGDFETAMMVGREMDQTWESGSGEDSGPMEIQRRYWDEKDRWMP